MLAPGRGVAATRSRLVSPYVRAAGRPPLKDGALLKATVIQRDGTQAPRRYLSRRRYEDIRDGSLELLRQYPPRRYYYLTLGRSPTPIAAFLENLGADHTNLPVSGLRKAQVAGNEVAWFAHFDRFLPKEALEGSRTLLLIDRSTTGATLLKAQSILQAYLLKRRLQVQVDVVAFARQVKQVPLRFIDVTKKKELIEMNRDHNVPWALYPAYVVGRTPPEALVQQPGYGVYKAQLLERMQRDPKLADVSTLDR